MTFDELVALGGRFIAGEIERFPGWGAADLDRESDPLREHLLACHSAGFLTVASQPGVSGARDHDGQLRVQRAFVCGFASEATARKLARLCNAADLEVRVFGRDDPRGDETAVASRGGTPYAFAGYNAFEEELECFSGACSRRGLKALAGASYVSLIDLVWGREDRLWTLLNDALRTR